MRRKEESATLDPLLKTTRTHRNKSGVVGQDRTTQGTGWPQPPSQTWRLLSAGLGKAAFCLASIDVVGQRLARFLTLLNLFAA